MAKKKLHIVLHAHLPYVLGHGTWPHGEHWLCEAIVHCYLPLIEQLKQKDSGDGLALSMVLTPVLCEQLADTRTKDIVVAFCEQQLTYAQQGEDEVAKYWTRVYSQRMHQLQSVDTVLSEFAELQRCGCIQILTCAATHAYMPLVGLDGSNALQYWSATEQYKRAFGVSAQVAWTPECAVRPAYEWCTWLPVPEFSVPRWRKDTMAFLAQYELGATIVEQNTLLQSPGYTRADVLEPGIVQTDFYERDVCVYARHNDASWQVWSSIFGYPGEFSYLEFHKRDMVSGLRKWRITGAETSLDHKEEYAPGQAAHSAQLHADDWLNKLSSVFDGAGDDSACTVAFDAELFGHWWHEGPQFLGHVLENVSTSSLHVEPLQVSTSGVRLGNIQESSWGDQGNHDTWMNEQTYWLWQRMYQLEIAVRAFVQTDAKTAPARVTAQVLRELMLAQASDWPFLITQGDAADYATQRFHCHEQDALNIIRLAKEDMSRALEHANRCFEQNPVFGFLEEALADALLSFLNEPADAGL